MGTARTAGQQLGGGDRVKALLTQVTVENSSTEDFSVLF